MKGEEFLNKLYRDLAFSIDSSSSDKVSIIKEYMNKLETVNSKATTEHKKDLLLAFYYKKYIIKKDNIPDYFSDNEKDNIIYAQKESLKKWFMYLTDENTKYPMWAKYWAFQGMLRIGNYNEETDSYMKRNSKTISPYIEANSAIIAKCIEKISEYIDTKKMDDVNINSLIENGNFQKMYILFLKEHKHNQNINSGFEGEWVKYNYKNEEDAIKLFESLQGFGCPWCTSGSLETAKGQILGDENYIGGDFYVYYTYDDNKIPKYPRIAIRMNKTDEIGEIRGVADDSQNVEEGFEEIIKNKLQEMDFISEETKQDKYDAIEDLRMLTLLNQKTKKHEQLSEEEYNFLYESERFIKGFGWYLDPRIESLRLNNLINNIDLALKFKEVLKKKNSQNKDAVVRYLNQNFMNEITNSFDLLSQLFDNKTSLIMKYASPKVAFEMIEKDSDLGIGDTNEEFRKSPEFVIKYARLLFEETGMAYILRDCSNEIRSNKEVVIELLKLDAANISCVAKDLVLDDEVLEAANHSAYPSPNSVERRYKEALEYWQSHQTDMKLK